jgi:hypothetical protein
VKILLWTLAVILALNALVAVWFALWAVVLRYQRPRGFVGETGWPRRPTGPVGVARLPGDEPRQGGRLLPFAEGLERMPIRPGPAPAFASGRRHRRWVGIGLAAAILCAGTAFASPAARQVVAGALGAVARGFQPEPAHQAGDPGDAGGDGSSPGSGSRTEGPLAAGAHPVRSTAGLGIPPKATAAGSPRVGTTQLPGPTTVTAVAGSSSELDVAWTDVAGETAYRVERSSDGATGWITVATTDKDVTSLRDTALPPGTTFYYRVFATKGRGDSPPSGVVSATTTVDPPSPATVTAATVSSTELGLAWTDVAGETGYRVERSSDGATGWITIATTGQDVTSYNDAGLPSGTTLYYRVFATNAGGDSSPSDVVSATTAADGGAPSPESEG